MRQFNTSAVVLKNACFVRRILLRDTWKNLHVVVTVARGLT